jgi:hypothetical protein
VAGQIGKLPLGRFLRRSRGAVCLLGADVAVEFITRIGFRLSPLCGCYRPF